GPRGRPPEASNVAVSGESAPGVDSLSRARDSDAVGGAEAVAGAGISSDSGSASGSVSGSTSGSVLATGSRRGAPAALCDFRGAAGAGHGSAAATDITIPNTVTPAQPQNGRKWRCFAMFKLAA